MVLSLATTWPQSLAKPKLAQAIAGRGHLRSKVSARRWAPRRRNSFTAQQRENDGLWSREKQENAKSRQQGETVLQKACNNLNFQQQSTWMPFSNSHSPDVLLITENQKLIQSSHQQRYLTILCFTSLMILLRLSGYFPFVLQLLQIACSCVLLIFLLKYLLFSY